MIFVVGGAYQGKNEYAKNNFDCEIISGYHLRVREQLKEGKDPLKEAERLIDKNENIVIVSDELGYGLVPVDEFERRYREVNGRVNCYFAGRAEAVIRVVCGIGQRIK
jgi:adenosylcobinamide kinase/adenosylcobinamide-phosphate guanylyltransferase